MQAHYEPVDLADVTADLASVFRSAVDRAGLQLDVVCPPLDEPVYVDRDMWEKVILNLLSNALKFTFDGSITVQVLRDGAAAMVTVADTGDRRARRRDAPAVRAVPPHRDGPRPVQRRQRHRPGPGEGTGRHARRHHHRRERRRRRHHLRHPPSVRHGPPARRRPRPRLPHRGTSRTADPVRARGAAMATRRRHRADQPRTRIWPPASTRVSVTRPTCASAGRRRQRRHARLPGAAAPYGGIRGGLGR